jgi:hypothetical protein
MNIRKRYTLLCSVAIMTITICTSCFKKDEPIANQTKASGDIIFKIPDAALAAPAKGQPQLAQPDVNVASGNFAITDDFKVTVSLPAVFTNLNISTLVTAGNTESKGSFSGVSGSVDWTYPVNTLAIGNKAPATASTVILQFVASNNDGSVSATRIFSVNVLDPFTLATTNVTTAYPDSTISLAYTIPAATTLSNIAEVDLFVKRGKNNAESPAGTKTYSSSDLSKSDKFTYVMPDENPSGALDTLYFRYVATFGTGRTVTKTATVRFVNVPMTKTTSGIGLFNPAITTADTTHTAYDFGKLAYVAKYKAGTTKDIVLTVSGSDIGFASGSGNATSFVKSTSSVYASPTFQSLRNAFAAGTEVTSVTDVYLNDIYIVKIDGNSGSSQYGIFKVTGVTLTSPSDNTDNIVIEFKSK